MANQYVNKVVQSDGTVLIDISDTTAIAADVVEGKNFYLASGQKVSGAATEKYIYQDNDGFIRISSTLPDADAIMPVIVKYVGMQSRIVNSENTIIATSSGEPIVALKN